MRVMDPHIGVSRSACARSFGAGVLLLAAALIALPASQAHAAGTPAGTVIRTRASAVYSSRTGARVDTSYSQFVAVTVLQKAALNLSPASAAAAAGGGGASADFALSVTNSGNGTDRFRLAAHSSKGWNAAVYADANKDGVLQSGELAAGPAAQTPDLAADASCALVLRVTVPPGQAPDGAADTTALAAQSVFSSAASAEGRYVTSVRAAALSGVVTADNLAPKPGETVTFTCVFTNTGSVRADNAVISAPVASGFTVVSASGGTVTSSANPVTWSVGAIEPAASATVYIIVRVGASVLPRTVLSMQMSAAYASPSGSYTSESSVAQVTVAATELHSASISPYITAAAAECGDTVAYGFRVTNTGTAGGGITLRAASSGGSQWRLYRDGNDNGTWDRSDPLIGGASGAALDSVAAGDSVRIFAAAILPRTAPDQSRDSLRVTAAPSAGGTEAEAIVVTTVNGPAIVVAKTIVPAGNHPSGTEVTYTIAYSNTAHASVDNFSVVDTAPPYTEYVSNSIKIDGIAAFDNEGPVTITTNAQDQTVISVAVGRLSGSKRGSVEFKVRVK